MKTRITELFGIDYPIMQGGLQWLGVPELAGAVSAAGGLGTINAACYGDETEFRQAIHEMKSITSKPFAVNLSFVPGTDIGEAKKRYLEIAGEEGVAVLETAGGAVSELRPLIAKTKMVHVHKCGSLRHALRAQKDGVDAVTLVGYEAAGHPDPAEIGSMVLFNYVAKHLTIPVLGGGGIADGRSFAAALALGCEGVVVGTRFVASQECQIHQNFKDAIVAADEKSTLTCQRNIRNMCRLYKNRQSLKAKELEEQGAGLEETLAVVSGELGRKSYQSGDSEAACFALGAGAAMVGEILPVAAIIQELVGDARKVVENLGPVLA